MLGKFTRPSEISWIVTKILKQTGFSCYAHVRDVKGIIGHDLKAKVRQDK